MDTTGSTVIGAFNRIEDARRAVSQLHGAGFSANEVKLIPNDQDESWTADTRTDTYNTGAEHKGGVMNFFARLFGFDEDDNTSTTAGRSSHSMGQDTHEYFSEHYQGKRHLVVVYSNAHRSDAISIIQSCGGLVEDRASALYEQERMKSTTQRTGDNLDISQREVLRLSEEELVANKEVVQTGEVTLRKDVVTETKTIQVPVSREEIVIERHAINPSEISASSGTDTIASESREIRIPVSEERIVVDKVVVPREEVRVSKQRVERTEEVSEELRREELEVDRDGSVNLRQDDASREEELTDEELLTQRRRAKDADRTNGSRPYV